MSSFKYFTTFLAINILAGFTVTGCNRSHPEREYMPDMYESTSFKAQKEDPNTPSGSSTRVPPDGTIARGYEPYPYETAEAEKAATLKNPLMRTKMNLERGQKIFNTYCIVCHGPKGDGQGFVVPPYPRPPPLFSDKVTQWPDGRIYHVITRGQNLMPSYATQIQPADRWAVIHYVRALQRAAHPLPQDVNEMKEKEAGK